MYEGMSDAETLKEIEALDSRFSAAGGAFFHLGKDAFATAEAFTRIHIRQYRSAGSRPSLPLLAAHHAARLDIDKDSDVCKALMAVAIRAETKEDVTPEYHNRFHFIDVAAMTANLLEQSAGLSTHEKALAFIAALGHDIGHQGRINPPDDLVRNEERSFRLIEPLLREAGLSAEDIGKIRIILLATSPDGPHSVMRAAVRARRDGQPVSSTVDPQGRFPALKKALTQDGKLLEMAAIVCDSDIYASSGAGLESSKLMSSLLTAEQKRENKTLDLTSDKARKFFLDNVIGRDGYASAAGRAAANDSFLALLQETEQRIAKTSKRPPSL
jgi:hypothetical protein